MTPLPGIQRSGARPVDGCPVAGRDRAVATVYRGDGMVITAGALDAARDLLGALDDELKEMGLKRSRFRRKDFGGSIGLDHLMFAAAGIGGNPFMAGNAGVGSYAAAGSAGHGPVKVVLGPPVARRADRRPGVVVMDTGIGAHPWSTPTPSARSCSSTTKPRSVWTSLQVIRRTRRRQGPPNLR